MSTERCQLVGGNWVARSMVGIAKASEGVSLVVEITEFAEQDEGLLVTLGGLGVVAEVVMGVAEAVPGRGLSVASAKLL